MRKFSNSIASQTKREFQIYKQVKPYSGARSQHRVDFIQISSELTMTSVDLGMFGLDCFVSDKSSSSLELDSDLCIQEFESLLQDNNSQNILDISLEQSGITENNNINNISSMSNMDTLEVSQTRNLDLI